MFFLRARPMIRSLRTTFPVYGLLGLLLLYGACTPGNRRGGGGGGNDDDDAPETLPDGVGGSPIDSGRTRSGKDTGEAPEHDSRRWSEGTAGDPGVLFVVNESGGPIDGIHLAECGGEWGGNELLQGALPAGWYIALLDLPLGCLDVLAVDDLDGYWWFPDLQFTEEETEWTLHLLPEPEGDDDDGADDDDVDDDDDDDVMDDDDAIGTGFECDDGTFIPEDWVCDGDEDCPDGEDEEGCSDEATVTVVNATGSSTNGFWFTLIEATDGAGAGYTLCGPSVPLETGENCVDTLPSGETYDFYAEDSELSCWAENNTVFLSVFEQWTWTIEDIDMYCEGGDEAVD
jgi:hypothetical protein